MSKTHTPVCDDFKFKINNDDHVVPLIIAQSIERQKEDWREEAIALTGLNKDLRDQINDLNAENIELKGILKTLLSVDDYKMQGHECYAKHVLLSMRDRLIKSKLS